MDSTLKHSTAGLVERVIYVEVTTAYAIIPSEKTKHTIRFLGCSIEVAVLW